MRCQRLPRELRPGSHHRLQTDLQKGAFAEKTDSALGLPRGRSKEPTWRVAVENEITMPTETHHQSPGLAGLKSQDGRVSQVASAANKQR